MIAFPQVDVRRHDTRLDSVMHRARSRSGQAVSVRTTQGRVDHDTALALLAALRSALADIDGGGS